MDTNQALQTLEHDSAVLESRIEGLRRLVLRFAEDIDREAAQGGTAFQRARRLVRAIETREQMLAPELQSLRDLIVEVAMDSARATQR